MTKYELIQAINNRLGYTDYELESMAPIKLLDIFAMLMNDTDYIALTE